jgi:hypothetical protein
MADDSRQQRKPDLRSALEDVKALATVLVMKLESVLGRRLNLRSPAVLAAVGVVATLVLALVVIVALLLTAGGSKALSNNAALIGALVALGGVFTAQLVSIALAERRTLETRQDDIVKETRLAVAELTRSMAAAIQAMAWFTAIAANTPDKLTQEDILDYDKEIKELLPNIVGALLIVSALDNEISDQLSPFMQEIYRVDGAIGAASREFTTSPEQSAKRIKYLYAAAVLPLYSKLPQRVSGIAGLQSIGENLKKGVTPYEGGSWGGMISPKDFQDFMRKSEKS